MTTRPMGVCSAVGIAVVAVDLSSKAAITIIEPLHRLPFVLPVQNPGYLTGVGAGLAPGLISLSLLLIVGWRLITMLRSGAVSPAGVGLVLGGCLANVCERLARGAVTDFIRLPWIVLDLADVAVLSGLVLLAVKQLGRRGTRGSRRESLGRGLGRKARAHAPSPPPRPDAGFDRPVPRRPALRG